MNVRTRKLVILALFISIGIVISYFESFIPIPLPGVKLGLANIFTLVVLYLYSPKEYIFVGLIRVLIVSLLRGSLISFSISIGGYVSSTIIVLVLYYVHKNSIYGISIMSALFHSIGQIIVVLFIYSIPHLINYLPLILISSIISSIIVALLSSILLKRTSKIILKGELDEEEN